MALHVLLRNRVGDNRPHQYTAQSGKAEDLLLLLRQWIWDFVEQPWIERQLLVFDVELSP